MNCIFLSHFEKQFDRYARPEQELINDTLQAVITYLETKKATYGLRIKKLSAKIYEARINIKLRIAYFKHKDTVKFFCLGNHDDIARCLKRLKSIKI
jgi:mRNA-degrading endonuclease YafQ of YafQ-DinJ toxin-antitoxin module